MMLQTVMFQTLTSLNSWYMFFQRQAFIVDSESAKLACKSHAVSAENFLCLLLYNTWFGYWQFLSWTAITISKYIILKLLKVLVK